MSKVLSVQYGPSELSSPELRNFKEKGVIHELFLKNCFNSYVSMLTSQQDGSWRCWYIHIGIATKVREKETHYFISAVLPERQIHLPEASVATLGFTFSFHSVQYQRYTCIPTGLFHRLAVDIASSRQALEDQQIKPAYIGGSQWEYCPSQSDSTQFYFSQDNAHILLFQKEDLIHLQLLVPADFSQLGLSLTELCKYIRMEIKERIAFVSKAVFGSEFLAQKATLEDGVICRYCEGSTLHLLQFKDGNQRRGLCTRLNKVKPLSPRESVWVAKEHGSDTISVSLIYFNFNIIFLA